MNILKDGLLKLLKNITTELSDVHINCNNNTAEILDIEANLVENVIDEFNTFTEGGE